MRFLRAATQGALPRFETLAPIVPTLQHPNIVPIHEWGVIPGEPPYVVTELVASPTLVIDRRFSVSRACRIATDILAALATAHEIAVVHGDVRPAKVFLASDRAMLVDFGIAKVFHEVDDQGAPKLPRKCVPYMAPRRLQGEPPTRMSDIFAAGICLFEMLVGRTDNDQRLAAVTLASLSDVPPTLAAVVEKAIATDLNRRYDFAVAMQRALAPFV